MTLAEKSALQEVRTSPFSSASVDWEKQSADPFAGNRFLPSGAKMDVVSYDVVHRVWFFALLKEAARKEEHWGCIQGASVQSSNGNRSISVRWVNTKPLMRARLVVRQLEYTTGHVGTTELCISLLMALTCEGPSKPHEASTLWLRMQLPGKTAQTWLNQSMSTYQS